MINNRTEQSVRKQKMRNPRQTKISLFMGEGERKMTKLRTVLSLNKGTALSVS
jgi:hypothetical protein